MYLIGGLLALMDCLGVLTAPITSLAAGCAAAISGAGLVGVLNTSVYVGGVLLVPCGSSWAGVCGASGICSSCVAGTGASSVEGVPSTGEGTAATNLCEKREG